MADDIEMMVASLSVENSKLRKQLENASGFFDKHTLAMERRAAKMKRQIDAQMSKIGSGIKWGVLAGTGIAVGMAALVNKSLEAASSIGETAIKAGVSAKRLQELRFAASQTGSSFESMDSALITFNKNFGDLLNTGKGKLAVPFKQFGLIDEINSGKIRNGEQAYDAYIAKVAAVGDASQRSALLAAAFGKKAGPEMAEMIGLGIDGMAALQKQANDLHLVLPDEMIQGAKEAKDKLAALFNIIEMQGVAAVANLAPQIGELAQQITNGMPDLILWVEKWADWFGAIKMSSTTNLKAEISELQDSVASMEEAKGKWTWSYGVRGLFPGFESTIADKKRKLAGLNSDLAQAEFFDPSNSVIATGDHKTGNTLPKLHVSNPNASSDARAAEAEAEREARMAARVQQIISSTGADALTAQAALAVATDRAAVDMLKSTTGYYEAVKKMVDSDLAQKLAALDAEKHAKLRHLATLDMTQLQHMQAYQNIQSEFAAKVDAAKAESGATLYQEMGSADLDSRIRDLKMHMVALGMTAEAAERAEVSEMALAAATALEARGDKEGAAALREKLAVWQERSKELEKATIVTARAASEADALRDALEGIASGDPFANLVKQLEQALIKLEIIDPLIEKITGRRGTPLGGMLGGATGGSGIMQGGAGGGGLLGSLFGGGTLFDAAWGGIGSLIPSFAVGTDSAPGGLAQLHKDEILNIPKGTQVIPRAPSLAMLRGNRSTAISLQVAGSSVVVQGNANRSLLSDVKALMDDRDRSLAANFHKLVYKAQRDHM